LKSMTAFPPRLGTVGPAPKGGSVIFPAMFLLLLFSS
jgi:hypothetical protein